MERGSETIFRPGPSFAASKHKYLKVPNVLKDKKTLKCIKCRGYRVLGLGFQEEGDICRYCRAKPRKDTKR